MKKQIVAASIALALALTADAKTFTWASSLDALSMDPYSTNNTFTNHFMSNIYEALVRFNEKVQIEPALAESWQSVSPTVWRFKLRRNVKFHNGEPFTADDVVFSWQRIQTPGSDRQAEPRRRQGRAQGRRLHRRRGDEGAVPAASQRIAQPDDHEQVVERGQQRHRGLRPAAEEGELRQPQHQRHRSVHAEIARDRRQDRACGQPELVGQAEAQHRRGRLHADQVGRDAHVVAAVGRLDATTSVPLQDVQRINSSGNFTVVQGPELRTIFFGMDQFRDELLYSDVKGKNPFKDVRVRGRCTRPSTSRR